MTAMEKGKDLARKLNVQLDTMGLTGTKRTETMLVLMTGATFGARVAGDNELAEHVEMRCSLFQEALPPKTKRTRKPKDIQEDNQEQQAKAA